MSQEKKYCKYCNKEIEWKTYTKQDGSKGFRPVDPGSDSHECVSTMKLTDILNRLEQVVNDLKVIANTK